MLINKFHYWNMIVVDMDLQLLHNKYLNNQLNINIDLLLMLFVNKYPHVNNSLLYTIELLFDNVDPYKVMHKYNCNLYLLYHVNMFDYSDMEMKDMDLMVFHIIVPYVMHHMHIHNEFLLDNMSLFDKD
jgi:hypothetical protein